MNDLYLPEYASQVIVRPGGRVGKGGNPHHYLVAEEKYQRVTTILDKTVPKPALIPWARKTALADAKAALLGFGYEYFDSDYGYDAWVGMVIDHAQAEPDRVKDEAADWGQEAHGHIQRDIEDGFKGLAGTAKQPSEFIPTLNAFYQLADELQITWRATEMVVWSPTLHVAGMLDAVGQLPDGSWIIMDWKTGEWKESNQKKYGSGFFWPPENALQVAAYASMFTEVTGYEVAQAWVVRFPRNALEPQPCNYIGTIEGIEVACIGGKLSLDGQAHLPHADCENGLIPAPGFEARQILDLEEAGVHYGMLVDHARWLAKSPWKEE